VGPRQADLARQDRHDEGRQGLTQRHAAALRGAAWAAVGAVAVVVYDPFRSHRFGIVCPMHALTGLDCPACGTTRAADQLAHGHLLGALRCNALAVIVGVWVVGWWVHAVWPTTTPWLARWATPLRLRSPLLVRTLLLVALAFTVARNLPGPDRWLAPPSV
jgi:hypothetical protein